MISSKDKWLIQKILISDWFRRQYNRLIGFYIQDVYWEGRAIWMHIHRRKYYFRDAPDRIVRRFTGFARGGPRDGETPEDVAVREAIGVTAQAEFQLRTSRRWRSIATGLRELSEKYPDVALDSTMQQAITEAERLQQDALRDNLDQ